MEKIYNNLNPQLKTRINLPNYYFDLSVDQQSFINALLEDTASAKMEQIKSIYKRAALNFNELSMAFDRFDTILEEE